MPLSRESLEMFKSLFEAEYKSMVYSQTVVNPQFEMHAEDLKDENDAVSTELETSMRIRLRNREALYLKKIRESLHRIQDGDFGQCMSCEEDIDVRRLTARPTATLCVDCKEEQEHTEVLHIDGHRHKSLGWTMAG